MDNETIQGEVLLKHPGGRPLKYKSAKQMQVIIDQYFDDCRDNYTEALAGEYSCKDRITDNIKPTVSGLAYVLDLTRNSLINYEGRPEFLRTVRQGRARIEQYLEQRLYETSPAGAIFNLKNNYGWRDEKHLTLENNEIRTIKIITGPDSALTKRLEQADTGPGS